MVIVRDIQLNPERRQILRREGIKQQSAVRPEISILIDELLARISDEHLFQAVCAYEIYQICGIDHDQITLAGDVVMHSPLLASALSDAEELAMVVCTIGPGLEQQVTRYLEEGEPLRGILLDGIGSAAVDSLAQEACKLIQSEASLLGYRAGSPCSPGIPGFPITEQWPLFKMVPAGEIGVKLTASGLMVPRKSASIVIGLGHSMATREKVDVCARCNLSETCHYRMVAR